MAAASRALVLGGDGGAILAGGAVTAGHAALDWLARRPAQAAPGTPAYRPDLDGLRAVAVGLVIVTHAKWPWLNNGGDAGVTAFFVLSGFLITRLLLKERAATGGIAIWSFYRRRVIRLAPALLGLLAFTLVGGVIAGWPGHWDLGIASCLLYMSNWIQVGGISIGPLGHTWSLAIEEQFYLAWPAVLLVAKGRALRLAVAAIVVASLVRLVATGPLEYFSTATRADAILVGCVVAFVGPAWPRGVAVAGLAALVAVGLLVPPDAHDVAIPAAMLATAAVIGSELPFLGRLAPVGLRAYSLYLWNWPMTILFGAPGALAPLMTVLTAEISYRLLEAPVLHRGPGRTPAAAPVPVQPVAALASDSDHTGR